MSNHIFALKGIVVQTPSPDVMEFHENAYVVCKDGKSAGVFDALPKEYAGAQILDYEDRFILPGMSDLHTHASQYGFRAMGMLTDPKPEVSWFARYSLPEEARFVDQVYAEKVYARFVYELLTQTTTTRSVIFTTIHAKSTTLLMDLLESVGLYAYVGKVNMDRSSPPELLEDTAESLRQTEEWIERTISRYRFVKPIITPRFAPACSLACMEGLGILAEKYGLPVQSHMSASREEIQQAKAMMPTAASYGEVYDAFGLLGRPTPAIMAHVVYPEERDYELLLKNQAWVAHCPRSNTNACNGVAPVKEMLTRGVRVGLASDVGSNFGMNLLREIANAIQVSKLRWRLLEAEGAGATEPTYLTLANAFYMATKGGGSFFGRVGSFEEGYEFDAVVMDDRDLADYIPRALDDRLQRLLWLSKEDSVLAKYVSGREVYSERVRPCK